MVARWILFASSYSPLFALTSLRLHAGDTRTGTWLAAAATAALLGVLMSSARRVEPRDRVFVEVQDRGGDVAGYLATYLLPFLVTPEPSRSDLLAYSGFLLLVGLVYTRSSLVAVNPLLYAVGYRLFFTTTTAGDSIMLVARTPPPVGEPVRVRTLIVGGLALRTEEQKGRR